MAGAAHGDFGAAGQRHRPRRRRNRGAAAGDGVGGAERHQVGVAEPLHQPAAGIFAAMWFSSVAHSPSTSWLSSHGVETTILFFEE